jgi:hypothetical protein
MDPLSSNSGFERDINYLFLFIFIYLFIYFAELGLELRAYTLSHSISLFLWWVFFQDGVSRSICPDDFELRSS